MTTQNPSATADAPIANFSQCHVGILSHLNALAELPGLIEPAARSRQIADDTLKFFRAAVYEHHAEEERELFPAVLASAAKGDERQAVQQIVDRLTQEHRRIEGSWALLEPELKLLAKGQALHKPVADVSARVSALVSDYQAHAQYEEAEFLPLSQQILGRNSNHMAALGLSLHLRHAVPAVLERLGHRA
jgi:hemerythrin-like domain-containing protein